MKTKKLGWPGAILLAIAGSIYGTNTVVNPGTDYIVTWHVVQAPRSRVERQEREKKVKLFCGWLDSKQQHSWSLEAKAELGLCP